MFSQTFIPTCQYFYTDISIISVTFSNSVHVFNTNTHNTLCCVCLSFFCVWLCLCVSARVCVCLCVGQNSRLLRWWKMDVRDDEQGSDRPLFPQLLVWSHEDDRWWLRSSSSSCVVSPSHKSPSTNLQKLQKICKIEKKKYIGQTETTLSATCIRRHIYLFRLIIAIVPFNVESKIKLAKDGMMSATLSASAIKCSSPFLILPAPGAWCKYGVRNNWNIKLFYQLSVTSSPIITPSSGCLASFCSSYWEATIYTQPNPRKNETLLQN